MSTNQEFPKTSLFPPDAFFAIGPGLDDLLKGLADNCLRSASGKNNSQLRSFVQPIRILQDDKRVMVDLDCPGCIPECIKITADGNILHVEAKRFFGMPDGPSYEVLPIATATTSTVDVDFDADVVLGESKAIYQDGVLYITAQYTRNQN